MKTEELMIGDWVYLINTVHNVSFPENGIIQDEGYTTNRTPIEITTISENCVSYYSKKFESYITLSSEDIEPIVLTPEILEKNGFKKLNWWRYKQTDVITYDIADGFYLEVTDTGFALVDDLSGDGDHGYMSNWIADINYIHELQHILKLCKIEKEIVL